MKNFYNLSELLSKVELDPNLLGGPLRYLYWDLVRQKIPDKAGWEKALVKLSHDERFCKQVKARRREFCDRLTYSLVKGAPEANKGATELTWNRFILGLVLLEITECTLTIKAKRKVLRRHLTREMSMSFNPYSLNQAKRRSDEDTSVGLSRRLGPFINNPTEAIEQMSHPLGKFYWSFVDSFQIKTVENWNRFMSKYLQNPKNVPQIGKYREDLYNNLKKAVCNVFNLTWLAFCRALAALSIDEIEFTLNLTDSDDKEYTVNHTVDMGELKFIQTER